MGPPRPAEPLQAAEEGWTEIAHGAAEGEDGRMGTRVGQREHEAEGLTLGVTADRDPYAGVSPVELPDLAGQVARALEGPRGEEGGTDPGEVLLPGC